MGILDANLAEAGDTDAAYFLMEALLEPDSEPPPHEEMAQRMSEHRVRILAPDEIESQLPLYPRLPTPA
jgi:hypothetical protein